MNHSHTTHHNIPPRSACVWKIYQYLRCLIYYRPIWGAMLAMLVSIPWMLLLGSLGICLEMFFLRLCEPSVTVPGDWDMPAIRVENPVTVKIQRFNSKKSLQDFARQWTASHQRGLSVPWGLFMDADMPRCERLVFDWFCKDASWFLFVFVCNYLCWLTLVFRWFFILMCCFNCFS